MAIIILGKLGILNFEWYVSTKSKIYLHTNMHLHLLYIYTKNQNILTGAYHQNFIGF